MRALIPLTLCVLVSGCPEPPAPQEVQPRLVRTIKLEDTTGARSRVFSGTARSGQESRLSFKVSGTIRELAVKVGDQVKKGDLLASVDASDYELQVQEAAAAMAQASAQQRSAESTYQRISALYANRTASRQDLDNARAARDSAKASVYSIAKRIQLARSQVDSTRLTAPVDGAVSQVLAEVNENVQGGQPVVVVAAGEDIEVTVAVPEVLISGVKAGDKVSVRFDALKDKTFSATVTEIAVSGANTGSTFSVSARLEEKDPAIRPGMAAEVEFDFKVDESLANRIIVPPFSVGEDADGRFAFVLTGNKVQRREVEIGELVTQGLIVTAGLNVGDQLVVAGVTSLQDGQIVRVPGGGSPNKVTIGDAPAEDKAPEEGEAQ